MPFARLLPLVIGASLLGACAPTTPLFIAQVTTNELVEYKALKTKRMTAAIEDEGDLLTYSAMAIRDAHSDKAETLYLEGYRDRQLSGEVRAIALYQIGLIYMSRFNEQRDDAKALNYFYKVLNEFPASQAASRAEERIATIRQRADERAPPVEVDLALVETPALEAPARVALERAVERVREDRLRVRDRDAADRVHDRREGREVHDDDVVDRDAGERLHRLDREPRAAEGEGGVVIYGTPESPIEDLTIQNLRLKVRGGPLAKDWGGNFDLRPSAFPPEQLFRHDIPAFFVRHATGLRLLDLDGTWGSNLPDFYTVALELEDTTGLMRGFTSRAAREGLPAIEQRRSTLDQ